MQAGGDLVNFVKQYNESKLKDKGISLAVGLMFITDIHSLGVGPVRRHPVHRRLVLELRRRRTAPGPTGSWRKTGTRPTFAHAANYSAAMQYLEAVQAAGTDDADTVVGKLEGKKINDVFLRNGKIRAEDHRVIHDVYLAQVKPAAEVKEDVGLREDREDHPGGRGVRRRRRRLPMS